MWQHVCKKTWKAEGVDLGFCRQSISKMLRNSPAHARQVPPEVACSVSRADVNGVNKNRITLKKKNKNKIIKVSFRPAGETKRFSPQETCRCPFCPGNSCGPRFRRARRTDGCPPLLASASSECDKTQRRVFRCPLQEVKERGSLIRAATWLSKHFQKQKQFTVESFPVGVDRGQVVTRTASNQEVKGTPFCQLKHKQRFREGWDDAIKLRSAVRVFPCSFCSHVSS